MKTISISGVILLLGLGIAAQEPSVLSEDLVKMKKEVQQVKRNEQSLRSQLKQVRNDLSKQGESFQQMKETTENLVVKLDTLSNQLNSSIALLEKQDEALHVANQRTVISVIVAFALLLATGFIFLFLNRASNRREQLKNEQLHQEIKSNYLEAITRLDEKLLARIEPLEEKVY